MRDEFKRYVTGLFLAGAILVPGAAWAQTDSLGNPIDASEEAEEELEGETRDWSVSATLLTRGYQGMFASLENDDEGLNPGQSQDPAHSFDRWLNLYMISGGYDLDQFSLGAEVVWSHWMTAGGGYNGPKELRFEDPSLTATWKGFNVEAIDTRIAANYRATLPASDVSRTSNLMLSNSLSATASRTFFDKVSLSYTLSGGWNAHSINAPTVDDERAQVYRETDRAANGTIPTLNGFNTQFSVSNSFVASIPVWDKLSASVSYALTKYWSYDGNNDDEYTPDVEGIQTGRMTADLTVASASLAYPIGEHLSLSGGIRTMQAPKTDDNRTFRFPWWNFSGASANRSAFQLGVSGTY